MEQNFQTSFIPKKTIVKERVISTRSVSFLSVISFFIFLSVVGGTGALYLYRASLQKNIEDIKNTLSLSQDRFEPARIADLKALDDRLIAAKDILNKHITVTPIFEELQKITMKTVRFTSFDYALPAEQNSRVSVSLTGIAIGYRSVALQADIFADSEHFIDPVFSNLQLDEKGNVAFNLDFFVDSSFVNYKQSVLTSAGNNLPTNSEVNVAPNNQ